MAARGESLEDLAALLAQVLAARVVVIDEDGRMV